MSINIKIIETDNTDVTRHSLFSRKPISQAVEEGGLPGGALHRALGLTDLMALGIGAIIGTGIFVLSGVGAREAGPAVIISFLLSGFASALAALCYAELAAMIPQAGSAYTYSYVALGELAAWIIGWDLMLEYIIGASTVASGWSGYVVALLHSVGISLPAQLTSDPFSGGLIDLPALLIVALITTLVLVGIREGTRFTKVLVVIKLAVVLTVIGVGYFYLDPSNWQPFIPYGPFSIVSAAAVIFFAYVGFDVVSTIAEEARDPSRDLPAGIIGSLIICTVLYVAVGAVLTGMVPYTQVDLSSPIASAFDRAGLKLVSALVSTGVIVGLTSVMAALMIGQPRIFMAMARDGLLPAWAARVSPRFHTPVYTTLITGTVVALAAALAPIEKLAHMTSIGTLLAFVLVCAGVLVLRRQEPDLPRPFRCPGVPFVPALGIIICFGLMLGLPLETWLRLIIWMALGLAIYFTYSRKHSKLKT
ncbi:MAG TPA: amino acid permease [Methanotrichaceae archaeon]|nr:amino acid permease [Methanotrichaceae archaeon]